MKCFILVAVVLCFHQTFARYIPVLVSTPLLKTPRQDPIGGWIQSSEWFPIEINVPDTISFLGNGLSSGFMNFSTALANWIQQLPMFNRKPSRFRPKPYKDMITHIVFLPSMEKDEDHFNPFDGVDTNIAPMYP